MDSNLLLIAVIVVIFFLYSLILESKENNHSYIRGKASPTDSVKRSLKKIDMCLSYDLKTIKWRRCFVTTIIILILLFTLVKENEMTPKNISLHFTIIFTIIYLSWRNYSNVTGMDVYRIGRENIDNIYRLEEEKITQSV
jgi:hypothetical protein